MYYVKIVSLHNLVLCSAFCTRIYRLHIAQLQAFDDSNLFEQHPAIPPPCSSLISERAFRLIVTTESVSLSEYIELTFFFHFQFFLPPPPSTTNSFSFFLSLSLRNAR